MEAIQRSLRFFNSPVTLPHSMIHFILFTLFFLSGAAALIYQVIWQRMLFTVFGVDLQSITIIVSVFMFGLGMGGLMGGYLADWKPLRLLFMYTIVEISIALFGWVSPQLIDQFGNAMFNSSELQTGFAAFLILAVPTMLMGATFPILVKHVNSFNQNIGQTVGQLYFANTIGGAVGAYFSGFVLLQVMDGIDVIHVAVALNVIVALTVVLVFRGR